VPPVMAFHLGSLGFLSPFEFFDHREKVDDVLHGLLSMQHTCIQFRLSSGNTSVECLLRPSLVNSSGNVYGSDAFFHYFSKV